MGENGRSRYRHWHTVGRQLFNILDRHRQHVGRKALMVFPTIRRQNFTQGKILPLGVRGWFDMRASIRKIGLRFGKETMPDESLDGSDFGSCRGAI